eukprot:Skav233460  [mRNA]  locus=scaffold1080:157321:158529:+ [translate_table: standard]
MKQFGPSKAQTAKDKSLDKREESSVDWGGSSSSSASTATASPSSPSPSPAAKKAKPEVLDKRNPGIVLQENPQSLAKRGRVVLREALDKRAPKHPQPVYKGRIAVDCSSAFIGNVWGNMRVERLTMALLHLRRLKAEEEMRKCANKLTGKEFKELKELVLKLQEKDDGAPLLDKRRQLKKEDSEVSKDLDGFPKCFESPAKALAAEKPSLPKGGNSLDLAPVADRSPEKSTFFGKKRKGSGQVANSSTWQEEGQGTSLSKALSLEPKAKKKKQVKGKKGSSKKKPAAAAAVPEVAASLEKSQAGRGHKAKCKAKPAQKAALTKGSGSLGFARMYYKDAGKAAIRQTKPILKQLFQFGTFQLTKDDLYQICDTAIAKMLKGQLPVKDCEAWCKQRFEAVVKGT